MTKKENDCCCCCIQHERNCHKANAETPNEPIVGSKLKSDTNAIICEICGEFVPKGFGNVKRLRCPCHASKTGDGLFHSHSQEYLGIYCTFPIDNDENDHGKKPSRNSKYPWLDWRLRPLITNCSVDEKHFTWNLKRKVPYIPDIYFQEMFDINRKRYF